MSTQIAQIDDAVVRHGVVLEIAPEAFGGIEFRGVRRQILQCNGAALAFDVLVYALGAMRLQTIPDDQQLFADRGLQDFQELNHLGRANAGGKSRKYEIPAMTGSCFQLKLYCRMVSDPWEPRYVRDRDVRTIPTRR